MLYNAAYCVLLCSAAGHRFSNPTAIGAAEKGLSNAPIAARAKGSEETLWCGFWVVAGGGDHYPDEEGVRVGGDSRFVG